MATSTISTLTTILLISYSYFSVPIALLSPSLSLCLTLTNKYIDNRHIYLLSLAENNRISFCEQK